MPPRQPAITPSASASAPAPTWTPTTPPPAATEPIPSALSPPIWPAQPTQYSATVINNPLARTLVLDGSAFFQDDWRIKPNFMLGFGVRYEDQNWIHDHYNWAPRIALAWSPGRPSSSAAKTVFRAGYGWFYDRFTVPTAFSSFGGAPYVVQTLHDNGVNQQSYVVSNPQFFDPTAPASPSPCLTSSSVPSFHSIDPHFNAALDMQAGAGIDQQLTSKWTANITYLYTQGVHQYLSNNVTAPAFNPATYTVTGPRPPSSTTSSNPAASLSSTRSSSPAACRLAVLSSTAPIPST